MIDPKEDLFDGMWVTLLFYCSIFLNVLFCLIYIADGGLHYFKDKNLPLTAPLVIEEGNSDIVCPPPVETIVESCSVPDLSDELRATEGKLNWEWNRANKCEQAQILMESDLKTQTANASKYFEQIKLNNTEIANMRDRCINF